MPDDKESVPSVKQFCASCMTICYQTVTNDGRVCESCGAEQRGTGRIAPDRADGEKHLRKRKGLIAGRSAFSGGSVLRGYKI